MRFRFQAGFTLIELMIVVGIIGLLVAISIPAYDRYQAKTRQTEAKIALSAIYQSEKGFYSEYSAYASGFDVIPYTPEASRRWYTVGWSGSMTGTVTAFAGSYGSPVWDKVNVPPLFGCNPPASYSSLPAPAANDSQHFSVGAAGEVHLGSGCDIWTIDDTKEVANTVLGI